MQALAGDTAPVTWSAVGPALAWVAAIFVATVPLAVRVYRKRS